LDQFAAYLEPKIGTDGALRFKEKFGEYQQTVTIPRGPFQFIHGAPDLIKKVSYFTEIINILKRDEEIKIMLRRFLIPSD